MVYKTNCLVYFVESSIMAGQSINNILNNYNMSEYLCDHQKVRSPSYARFKRWYRE